MSVIKTKDGLLLDTEGEVKHFRNERTALIYCKLEGIENAVIENDTQFRMKTIVRKKVSLSSQPIQ